MVGQRGTAVLAFSRIGLPTALTGFLLLGRSGCGDFGVLVKVEYQLIQAFRLGSEPRLAMTGQLMFELLDLQCLGLGQIAQLRREGAKLIGIGRKGLRRLQHCWIYTG